MYTFGILAAFFLILSGVIFGKKIKQNQFAVVLIVFAGTLIGSVIVNGIVGLDIPLSDTEVKTKNLNKHESEIYTLTDTLEFYSYVEYNYEMEEDSTINYNFVEICLADDIYYSEREKLIIKYLPEGDSIPYVSVRKNKRLTDSKWITSFGLPGGNRHYVAYIPNDSIHNVLMDQLNDKFFIDEKEQIAQLD